jgi:hypothetical protein
VPARPSTSHSPRNEPAESWETKATRAGHPVEPDLWLPRNPRPDRTDDRAAQARLEHGARPAAAGDDTGENPPRQPPEAAAPPSQQGLRQAIIGQAADLLSGPGGPASFLRQQQLGARLSGPSLPLDIGYSKTIPPGIRNAVVLRDRRCRWPGGCTQPAAAGQVHHVRHLADGGPASLADCVLLCSFHHQVVIHRWGWTLVLNPDGTTMARSRDGGKVLRSHGPPAR